MLTDKQRQEKFRAKMYKNGFKQIIVWVKREEPKAKKMSRREFVMDIKKLTAGWEDDSLSWLYNLLIKIVKGKKEVKRIREKK